MTEAPETQTPAPAPAPKPAVAADKPAASAENLGEKRLPPRAEPAAVRVAGGRWQDDVRAVRVVWKRELIRFGRNRLRIITSLIQPVLFLFVLGTGLSAMLSHGAPIRGHVNFRTFIFPGVVAMTILFTSIFSAVSIVWDREFGFLREMLVAPVRRGALVAGKCAGGATVATIQGVIMLALAGLVGIPYSPLLLLSLLGIMVLAATAITAFGTALASRMAQVESFQVVMQMVVLPLFFLSGALFALGAGLPVWLRVLTRLDPLTYVVDPMRRIVFEYVPATPVVRHTFDVPVTWGSWVVPIGVELGLVAVFGLVTLAVAVTNFSKVD